MRRILFTALLALPLLGGVAGAENDKSNISKDEKKQIGTEVGDRAFIERAASSGVAEVKLAKLAEQKSTSDEVKRFARKMGADHAQVNAELARLAKKQGVMMPTEVTTEQRATLDQLQAKSGSDFDKAFMDVMVKEHDSAVTLFRQEADSGSDGELRNWAAKTLPTLLSHDQMAHTDRDRM